jgi:protocatechuate 3,4-dioxygenase beta subunit
MPSAVALALLLAVPLCGVASTTARPVPDSATINGTIVDDSGMPAKDATVFVYSAHLKNGYAIVCPTCWIDCGKRAGTDTQGQFTITGLNPNLRFRLLVLKEGFTATAKGGVDPAQGPLPPIKLHRRAPSTDEARIVHGRVTDVGGNPIAGALIEPLVSTDATGGMSMGMNWMDPLAATNASGEFEIVSTQAFEKVTLKISPRALAPQIATALPGPAFNAVVLTEGATVMGRLAEPNGTPIAHAEVVMTAHYRGNGEDFSDMRVGTDHNGFFVFTNVPPRRVWGIYPTSESLQSGNLTAGPSWCETTADRQVIDAGRITLHPGFSVSGKIDLLDKSEIPPGMHVSIWSEWAADNRLTDIASDGSFEFKTLAPGIYSLNAAIVGYTPTADTARELLVERDRRDVVIHMARSTGVSSPTGISTPMKP